MPRNSRVGKQSVAFAPFARAVTRWAAIWVLSVGTSNCASVASAQDRNLQKATAARSDASEASQSLEHQRPAAEDAKTKQEPDYHNEMLRGRVTWLPDALRDQFGISTVRDAEESGFALVTAEGELIPIVENLRGRAFRKDERLRNIELELLVRRYPKQPFVQILRIFEVDAQTRLEVDYWCDVCAIIMFELGPCSCCQDDNRIRKRPIEKADFQKLRSGSE